MVAPVKQAAIIALPVLLQVSEPTKRVSNKIVVPPIKAFKYGFEMSMPKQCSNLCMETQKPVETRPQIIAKAHIINAFFKLKFGMDAMENAMAFRPKYLAI